MLFVDSSHSRKRADPLACAKRSGLHEKKAKLNEISTKRSSVFSRPKGPVGKYLREICPQAPSKQERREQLFVSFFTWFV
jgi:hypothetical protein